MNTQLSVNSGFEQFRNTFEKFRVDLQQFLNEQPQFVPCDKHPKVMRPISRELSEKYTNKKGDFVAVYEPCSRCVAETQLSRENERLTKQGVPGLYLHCSFESWHDKDCPHLQKTREFACRIRRGFLLLMGPTGTGKTHLAVASMRCFSNALFVRHGDFTRKLRATYRDPKAICPIELAQKAGLLVFDDLGVSLRGNDENQALHDVFEFRYEGKLPTIITTNLDWPGVQKCLGERLADRLMDCTFATLEIIGDSMRGTQESRQAYFA